MKFPSSILVVIEGEQNEHAALTRALKFANQGNMAITLVSVAYDPLAEYKEIFTAQQIQGIRQASIADKVAYLNTIASQIQKMGIRCDSKVLWHKRQAKAIEEIVDALTPDLVVKAISSHRDSSTPLAMPIERHLLRYCQAPLLLLCDSDWSSGPVLCAVDASNKDPAHQKLNRSVLNCAQMLMRLIPCQSHVVCGYANLPEDRTDKSSEEMRNAITQWQQQQMANQLAEYDYDSTHVHLVTGSPDSVIPSVAKSIDAQMVIIGTMGKCGQSMGYIGNTAEQILAQIRCDVLALPPDQLEHIDALM